MSTPIVISLIVALGVAVLLSVIFIKPLKGLLFLLVHSAAGWAGLYIFNKLFAFASFSIGINIASASIAGILGLPGVALLAILKLIFV